MRIVFGGRAQGKLTLVLGETGIPPEQVWDGGDGDFRRFPGAPVVDHLHLLVRRLMEAGEDPQAYILNMVRIHPEIIFITDEIGCGIAPMDAFDRAWRETTGRICCELVQTCTRAERVFAGISTVLKER